MIHSINLDCPQYHYGNIHLYNCDCMKLMKQMPDKEIDLEKYLVQK